MSELKERPVERPPAILVVEDDPLVRLVAVEFLLSAGFSVLEAGTAAAAIDSLMDHRVDLVFSDIQMPGVMDGNELAEWIEINFPSVPVILASGVAPDRGHSAGGLLRKPYDLSALNRRILEVLAIPPRKSSESLPGNRH